MIKIEKNEEIEEMSLDEFSRWAILVEAFTFLEERAEQMGVELDKFIKPKAIEDYINYRFLSMRHDVGVEYYLGNI